MVLELSLGRDEQALLHHTVSTQGFQVLQRIMKAACDAYITELMNTPHHEDKKVLSRHLAAQVAAQQYTWIANYINEEIIQYKNAALATDTPIDITADVLDIGDEPEEFKLGEFGMDDFLEER